MHFTIKGKIRRHVCPMKRNGKWASNSWAHKNKPIQCLTIADFEKSLKPHNIDLLNGKSNGRVRGRMACSWRWMVQCVDRTLNTGKMNLDVVWLWFNTISQAKHHQKCSTDFRQQLQEKWMHLLPSPPSRSLSLLASALLSPLLWYFRIYSV